MEIGGRLCAVPNDHGRTRSSLPLLAVVKKLVGSNLHVVHLTLDRGEIAAARWFSRSELPADLSPYVVPIMARAPVVTARR